MDAGKKAFVPFFWEKYDSKKTWNQQIPFGIKSTIRDCVGNSAKHGSHCCKSGWNS
jgi:hypothetical protein